MTNLPRLLFVADIAALFRLSRSQAWRLVKSRKLGVPRQIGKGPLFLRREDFEEALEKAELPEPERRRRSPTIPRPDPEIAARLERRRAKSGRLGRRAGEGDSGVSRQRRGAR